VKALILFDGVCNLCNSTVRFIIKRDKKNYFQFTPLQGMTASKIIKSSSTGKRPESLVLFENNKLYYRSTAALRIARKLNGGWKLFYGLVIIPPFLRDPVYNLVASNRYKWFGKKDKCMVPAPELNERFLP
jgi:predicted DCC family thiol-disulfide oxidoreductase YuxK